MAHKLNATPARAPDTDMPAENPDDDLYTLMPDMELEVDGRELLLKEFSFEVGMRVRAKAGPLMKDLEAVMDEGRVRDLGLEDYLTLLAKHYPLVREMMLESIEGIDSDWLKKLDDRDGQELLSAWWATCGRFFWRAVVGRQRDRMLAKLRRKAREVATANVGSTSSSPPHAPAEPRSGSSDGAIPNAS